MGGAVEEPRPMDKIISYLKVGGGHRYPREFEQKMLRIQELFDAGEINGSQMAEMVKSASQDIEEYTGSDGRLRGSFIENSAKRKALDGRELMTNKMGDGGVIKYDDGGLLEALKRANAAGRDTDPGFLRQGPNQTPVTTEEGFLIKGDPNPNISKLKDVVMASETTNRLGGVEPQVGYVKYVNPGKMSMEKRELPREEPTEKPKPILIPPEKPTTPPKEIPPEVNFNMDTDGLETSALFDRGIAQSGMRGEGTTGGFRGVRSDITNNGRLIERGETTSVEDLPEYIREDPTFKNLLAQANETKYMQDIGRREGKYSAPGGQAAQDLADILSGRITLDAYKERQNRASASFGYGGKMKFGVSKKRRGGR